MKLYDNIGSKNENQLQSCNSKYNQFLPFDKYASIAFDSFNTNADCLQQRLLFSLQTDMLQLLCCDCTCPNKYQHGGYRLSTFIPVHTHTGQKRFANLGQESQSCQLIYNQNYNLTVYRILYFALFFKKKNHIFKMLFYCTFILGMQVISLKFCLALYRLE